MATTIKKQVNRPHRAIRNVLMTIVFIAIPAFIYYFYYNEKQIEQQSRRNFRVLSVASDRLQANVQNYYRIIDFRPMPGSIYRNFKKQSESERLKSLELADLKRQKEEAELGRELARRELERILIEASGNIGETQNQLQTLNRERGEIVAHISELEIKISESLNYRKKISLYIDEKFNEGKTLKKNYEDNCSFDNNLEVGRVSLPGEVSDGCREIIENYTKAMMDVRFMENKGVYGCSEFKSKRQNELCENIKASYKVQKKFTQNEIEKSLNMEKYSIDIEEARAKRAGLEARIFSLRLEESESDSHENEELKKLKVKLDRRDEQLKKIQKTLNNKRQEYSASLSCSAMGNDALAKLSSRAEDKQKSYNAEFESILPIESYEVIKTVSTTQAVHSKGGDDVCLNDLLRRLIVQSENSNFRCANNGNTAYLSPHGDKLVFHSCVPWEKRNNPAFEGLINPEELPDSGFRLEVNLEKFVNSSLQTAVGHFDQIVFADSTGEVIQSSAGNALFEPIVGGQKKSKDIVDFSRFTSIGDIAKHIILPTAEPFSFFTSEGKKADSRSAQENSKMVGYSHRAEVEVGGVRYYAFIQPFRLPTVIYSSEPKSKTDNQYNNGRARSVWYLIGFVNAKSFESDALGISLSSINLSLLFLAFVVSLLPTIWVFTAGKKLLIHGWQMRLVAASIVITLICGMLLGLNLIGLFEFRRDLGRNLEETAEILKGNFEEEVPEKIAILKKQMSKIADSAEVIQVTTSGENPKGLWKNIEANEPGENKKDDRLKEKISFATSFLLDSQGFGYGRHSSYREYEPELQLSQRRYFSVWNDVTAAESGKVYSFDGKADRVFLERIHSWLDGKNEVALSMPVTETKQKRAKIPCPAQAYGATCMPKVGVMITQLMSFFEPVLPPHTKFVVFHRDTGQVLFHSVRAQENTENFYRSTNSNKNLMGQVIRGASDDVSFWYQGDDVRAFVTPLSPTPWSLAVYRGKELEGIASFYWISATLSWVVIILLCYYIGIYIFILLSRSRTEQIGIKSLNKEFRARFVVLALPAIGLWLAYPLFWPPSHPFDGIGPLASLPILWLLALDQRKFRYITPAFLVLNILAVFWFPHSGFLQCLAISTAISLGIVGGLDRFFRDTTCDSCKTHAIAILLALTTVIPTWIVFNVIASRVESGLEIYYAEERGFALKERDTRLLEMKQRVKEEYKEEAFSGLKYVVADRKFRETGANRREPDQAAKNRLLWVEMLAAYSDVTQRIVDAMHHNTGQSSDVGPLISFKLTYPFLVWNTHSGPEHLRANSNYWLLSILICIAILILACYVCANVISNRLLGLELVTGKINQYLPKSPFWQKKDRIIVLCQNDYQFRALVEHVDENDKRKSRLWISNKNQIDIQQDFNNYGVIVLDAFESLVMERKSRQLLVEFLEHIISAHSSIKIIIRTFVVPRYWLAKCEDTEETEIKTFSSQANEKIRWNLILSRFYVSRIEEKRDSMVHRLAMYLDNEIKASDLNDKASYWDNYSVLQGSPELKRVVMQELESAPWLFEEIATAFKLISPDIEVDEAYIAEKFTIDLMQCASGKFHRDWSLCTNDEKLQLYSLASGGVVNARNEDTLRSLEMRGLIDLRDIPKLSSNAFGLFISSTVDHSKLLKWQHEGKKGLWSAIWLPIISTVILGLSFVVITNPEAMGLLVAIGAGVLGGLPALIAFIQSFRGGKVAPE